MATSTAKPTVSLQSRVPPELHGALARAAAAREVPLNTLVREALANYLVEQPPAAVTAGQLELEPGTD